MYVKMYSQVFGSSIADNWQHRHVFEDLLKLANQDGVVDMTVSSIVAITRMPKKMVEEAIKALCGPDPESRTPDHEGRRMIPLDPNRSWGWIIVNYKKYRDIRTEFDRTKYMREYMQKRRGVKPSLTVSNKKANSASASVPSVQGNGDIRGKGWPATVDDAIKQCALVAVDPVFVSHCWNKLESRGGLDSRGIPVSSFQAYVVTEWKYEQDRKGREKAKSNGNGDLSGADKIILQKEHDRADQAIKDLRSSYGDHQSMTKPDHEKLLKLLDRRKELKMKLGVMV